MGLTGLFAAFVSFVAPEPVSTFWAGRPLVSCDRALPTKETTPTTTIIVCFESIVINLYVFAFATQPCRSLADVSFD
jgi:hypothetical protein